MVQETNNSETVTKTPVEKIHTKLKFIKSERNGALISFVSQNPVDKIVCGVRQDSPYPKKIVIIDREIAHNLIVDMLYDCTLIPMTEVKNPKTGEMYVPGFIAIKANLVQFKATIQTNYIRGVKYNVEVSFGNKVIRFDPFRGVKETTKSLLACRAVLEKRCDIRDLLDVVEQFNIAANNLLALMKKDMTNINNKRRGKR